jgi:hypothetical protein
LVPRVSDEAFYGRVVVGVCERADDPARVTELHCDLPLRLQPFLGLVVIPSPETSTVTFSGSHSATPCAWWMLSSMTSIPPMCLRKLRMHGTLQCSINQIFTVECKMASPAVDRAVDQRRRACCGDEVEATPKLDRVDQVAIER